MQLEEENRRLKRELQHASHQRDILKNAGHPLGRRECFESLKAMSTDYSPSELCAAFDASRSGYHAWASRQPFARVQADAQLQPLILTAQREGRQEYSSPRVAIPAASECASR